MTASLSRVMFGGWLFLMREISAVLKYIELIFSHPQSIWEGAWCAALTITLNWLNWKSLSVCHLLLCTLFSVPSLRTQCSSEQWVSVVFKLSHTPYLKCTAKCRGEKNGLVGHVILKELGQSIIFVLTEFIVSNSSPLCLVGYHVHPIYILTQAS